jgi:hypothetical protein
MINETYKGYTIKIEIDENAEPEEKVGRFISRNTSRYTLGWETMSIEDTRKTIKEVLGVEPSGNEIVNSKGYVTPVYGYIHSGTALSLTPFACPWDSGLCGFYLVDKKTIKDRLDLKGDLKEHLDKIRRFAESEIAQRQRELNGECYGYIITDPDDEEIDSCWGFWGDSDYCLEKARQVVDRIVEKEEGKQADYAVVTVGRTCTRYAEIKIPLHTPMTREEIEDRALDVAGDLDFSDETERGVEYAVEDLVLHKEVSSAPDETGIVKKSSTGHEAAEGSDAWVAGTLRELKVMVACIDADGCSDLFFVKVNCSKEDYEEGRHIEAAMAEADRRGYDSLLAYDVFDSAGKAMISLFEWDTASVIEVTESDRI